MTHNIITHSHSHIHTQDGETSLHKACAMGHSKCVETICNHVIKTDDLYRLNKKQHTAAHVALNSAVLKVLYENGMNIFICDPKNRNPLFFASFYGRVDCIVFLIEIAYTNMIKNKHVTVDGGVSYSPRLELQNSKVPVIAVGSGVKAVLSLSPRVTPKEIGMNTDKSTPMDEMSTGRLVPDSLLVKDIQGDTALHAACLCGHVQCVMLLCYYLQNIPNKQGITPEQLAIKANHIHIAKMVQYYHTLRANSATQHNSVELFRVDFNVLSSTVLYYGSRWSQGMFMFAHTVYVCLFCCGLCVCACCISAYLFGCGDCAWYLSMTLL